ncbi:hypothetical protein L4D20_04555 [Vibrio kyushuensis]|uniref:hypothetical protein n=1 Tax=Vibrio kyushuensis TaxID=2910249 RepID=UPI003D13E61A
MNIKWTALSIVFALTACGGGGGGEGGGSSSSTGSSGSGSAGSTSTIIEESSTESAVVARTMQDLVVPDDFSYNPVMGHHFDVDISAYSSQRAYISVYGQFTVNQDGSYKPDFNSRITSTSLDNGTASLEFCISDSQSSVLAEIWFYDGSDPIQHQFTTAQNQWIW